jgi:ABC-type tungstate transport system permease subunit
MAKDNETPKDGDFQIVNENDLVFAKRGRKSNISEKELEMVRVQVEQNPNKWVLFNGKAIPSGMTDAKSIRNHKATVSANIRQIAKRLGMNVEIRWHEGKIPAAKFTKATKK